MSTTNENLNSKPQSPEEFKTDNLIEEFTPILKDMMSVGAEKLQTLEDKGYFRLANSLVNFLDVAVANASAAKRPKPIGLMGLAKATRDQDVQMGLAVAIEILRVLGRTAHEVESGPTASPALTTRRNLAAMLAPKAGRGNLGHNTVVAAPTPAPVTSAPHAGAQPQIKVTRVDLNKDAFLKEPDQWNREICLKIATECALPELSEKQWHVIEFCRKEYIENKATPNMRRLSSGTGLSTKELYTLFPHAPAKTVAKIAGCPKPAGCI